MIKLQDFLKRLKRLISEEKTGNGKNFPRVNNRKQVTVKIKRVKIIQ